MEALLISSIGDLLSSGFNFFTTRQQGKNQETAAETVTYQSIFGYQAAISQAEAQKIKIGTIAVVLMSIILIAAIAYTNKKR